MHIGDKGDTNPVLVFGVVGVVAVADDTDDDVVDIAPHNHKQDYDIVTVIDVVVLYSASK
jgi:hypothetical protein